MKLSRGYPKERKGTSKYSLDKIYFIKFKSSVNRVNSNEIISAMEVRAGKRCV